MGAAKARTFASLLRQHRLAAGLTQEVLAERSGLSARGVSDLERGARRRPHPETLRLLSEALGLSPADRAALARSAYDDNAPSSESPTERPPGPRLPNPLTPLLGRERDVAEVSVLLTTGTNRLVTLTGPGGVGKTRLALQAGATVADRFAAGAWFVDLAPLRDPALMLPTIAAVLGLRPSPQAPASEQVIARLRDAHAVLLLDNCEHLLAAAGDLTDLLAACPALTVLATSREAWRLRGEREVRVAPLPVPHPGAAETPATLADVPAVALFVQRAQAVVPSFALTADNVGTVAAICRQLDGLPLAIELAAARCKLLSPAALLERIEHRLAVLTDGARDLPPRQRTLRDTMAWSYDLLAPKEQRLFRRLAVFVGDCTLESAEAVADRPGDAGIEVLDVLAALVNGSLVLPRAMADGWDDDAPRFGMYLTIREFALDRLIDAGERDDTVRAMGAFLLDLAARAEPELLGADQSRWLDRLEAEHDNFRAALDDAVQREDGAFALRLAVLLWRFWLTRGHPGEGHGWLERAVAIGERAPSDLLARARQSLGHFAVDLGNYGEADAQFSASLALCRQAGDRHGIAESLAGLGVVALNRLRYDEARALLEEALAIRREDGDEPGVAGSLYLLAIVAREQGEQAAASDLFQRALSMWQRQGNTARIGQTLFGLGMVRRFEGNAADARRLIEEARSLLNRLGYRYWVAASSMQLGHIARMEEDNPQAVRHYVDSLALAQEVGANEMTVEDIEFLACVAAAMGDSLRAGRLFGAGATLRIRFELPPPMASEAGALEQDRVAAQAAAGAGWDAVWSAGRAMTLDEAVAEAQSLLASLPPD